MQMRSQIMQMLVPDKNGKPIKYYTYDGYLHQRQRLAIRKYRRDINKRNQTFAGLFSLLTYHGSRKSQLPSFQLKKWKIPTKGLVSGAVGFLGAYLLLDYFGAMQISQFETSIIRQSEGVPLWLNKNLAVNPDRAYFQLIDDKNNQLSIFHSGLTPDAASKILPDLIIGGVPIKPHDPLIDLH